MSIAVCAASLRVTSRRASTSSCSISPPPRPTGERIFDLIYLVGTLIEFTTIARDSLALLHRRLERRGEQCSNDHKTMREGDLANVN